MSYTCHIMVLCFISRSLIVLLFFPLFSALSLVDSNPVSNVSIDLIQSNGSIQSIRSILNPKSKNASKSTGKKVHFKTSPTGTDGARDKINEPVALNRDSNNSIHNSIQSNCSIQSNHRHVTPKSKSAKNLIYFKITKKTKHKSTSITKTPTENCKSVKSSAKRSAKGSAKGSAKKSTELSGAQNPRTGMNIFFLMKIIFIVENSKA